MKRAKTVSIVCQIVLLIRQGWREEKKATEMILRWGAWADTLANHPYKCSREEVG